MSENVTIGLKPGPIYKHKADVDYVYFLNDPEGEGLIFFKCIKERHKFARSAIRNYLDTDGWNEEDVRRITIGAVTHLVTEFNVTERPVDAFLEDNVDEDGVDWMDHDRRCDYKLTSLEMLKYPFDNDTNDGETT